VSNGQLVIRLRGKQSRLTMRISAVSHAICTLSGAYHDEAQRNSAINPEYLAQDAKAAKQVDSEVGVLGVLARENPIQSVE
jgi:hypothetical protein